MQKQILSFLNQTREFQPALRTETETTRGENLRKSSFSLISRGRHFGPIVGAPSFESGKDLLIEYVQEENFGQGTARIERLVGVSFRKILLVQG